VPVSQFYSFREGKDERQIDRPKDVLVSYRKNQQYREQKLTLIHKLYGIESLSSNLMGSQKGPRNWFRGYHRYESINDITSRFFGGKTLSCFRTSTDVDEVHIAFLSGNRDATKYLTLKYDVNSIHVQEAGVHFCAFWLKKDDSTGSAAVTTINNHDLQACVLDYALMLPLHGQPTKKQYTLVYSDWEVLRCSTVARKKGIPILDRRVFHTSDYI
jgi:hypothetical protein